MEGIVKINELENMGPIFLLINYFAILQQKA